MKHSIPHKTRESNKLIKPKSFTNKRQNSNQNHNKFPLKRKFSESNHNINESPQQKKRKLNICIQNVFDKNRQLRKEIYSIKQERDKYKKERDYYCKGIQKCLKIVQGIKEINPLQNDNESRINYNTETKSNNKNDENNDVQIDIITSTNTNTNTNTENAKNKKTNQNNDQHVHQANGNHNNKNNDSQIIFENENPIEIVVLLLQKYPQIKTWLQSMEYHGSVTTSHTQAMHFLTYLMEKQPQFTQVIKLIQQQLISSNKRQKKRHMSRKKTTHLSAHISPAPIHWKITGTEEKNEGKWKIKLKVIKNPLKDALIRIGAKRFNLDDMFDILADIEDNDDIKRTNTARRRLKEELLSIRGCYHVRRSVSSVSGYDGFQCVDEFCASDFIRDNHYEKSQKDDESDDVCYECGKCGELVCCDGCPHAFHLLCVGLNSVPDDKWFCNQCNVF